MLTQDLLSEVEKIAKKSDAVQQMLEEYRSFYDDPAKNYYQALVEASKELTDKIRDKTIDIDAPFEKSVIRLLESGEKVNNTLKRGQNDAGVEDTGGIKTQAGRFRQIRDGGSN